MEITTLLLTIVAVSAIQARLESVSESLNLCGSGSDVHYKEYTSNVTQDCGCEKRETCVRKCCQRGFYHFHDEDLEEGTFVSVCLRNESDSFSVPLYRGTDKVRDETDGFLIGTLNCNNVDYYQYFKMDNTDPNQAFYVQEDGSLHYEFYGKTYSNERYCIDEQNGLTAYLCFTPKPPEDKIPNLIHMTAKLVSVPFLAFTGLVYALLPERNLHRNALMSHVFSLIPGSAILAVGQYVVVENVFYCFSQAFLVLFFMTASFFWMNVICIDIWLAFSGLKGLYVQEKVKTISRIAALYAWGLPALNVLIVFLLDRFGDVKASYYPGIGRETCFLKEGQPVVIFYFVPIVILILINFGLFIITVVNILKAKRETKMVQNSQNKKRLNRDDYKKNVSERAQCIIKGLNRYFINNNFHQLPAVRETYIDFRTTTHKRFKLYWKLLFVMGLNPVVNTHVIQMISWGLFGQNQNPTDTSKYIWYYKDFSHACYGLVIFLIFVCQKRIWLSLKERFHWISKLNKSNSKISVTSSVASSSESGVLGIRLRGIQNGDAVVP